jgi:hypothetical protein
MKRTLTDNVVVLKACLFPKNKNESIFFSPMVLDFPKSAPFWTISRLRPFVLRVRQSVDKDEYGVLVE